MGQSHTEENYLKAIYQLSKDVPNGISTKSIGLALDLKSPTVSDMLKKLADKDYIKYAPYKGVSLTDEGAKIALKVIRKHRLWEAFLVEKFKFKWDEVHDIAEQLEHINSPELVNRLDAYLGYPQFDPHGDPIPDREGIITLKHEKTLDQIRAGEVAVMVGVKDHSTAFLKFLENHALTLGRKIEVLQITDYDKSLLVKIGDGKQQSLSHQVCKNLLVK